MSRLVLLPRVQRKLHMRLVVAKKNIQMRIGIRFGGCWEIFQRLA